MYVEDRSRAKRIAVDALGVCCIIGSALTGWLPGPGGLPLLIIGLSLLATNHHWAERILMEVKHKGARLGDSLFMGSPRVRATIDILSVVLVAAGVYVVTSVTKNIFQTIGISLCITAVVLLLANRNRYKALIKSFRQRHKSS